jgi:hypothetical protein
VLSTIDMAPARGAGFELVMPNTPDSREPVIMSTGRCYFSDAAGLEACLDMLRKANAPDFAAPDLPTYIWHNTLVHRMGDEGGTLVFTLLWYDEIYFDAHCGAYLDEMHNRLGARFGMSGLTVQHWRPV